MLGCRKPLSQTWRAFLENHAKQLVSVDFFTVPPEVPHFPAWAATLHRMNEG